MTVLEQIIQMKRQGIPDPDIVNELAMQGISPKEINDALKQAQIKSAVSGMNDKGELQPSIMPEEEYAPAPPNNQAYQPAYEQPQQEYAQKQGETYTPQEQQYYAPGQGYEQQQYPSAGIDADTVMEIADQIFSEKIKKIQKQLDATSEGAILLQSKTENISERLKKIETTIDKLQIAILEKVGSYGQNLESIRKEMSMMQDSFSKMVSPSRESRRQTEEITSEKISEEPFQKRISRKK
jgi:hypothetical protein